MWKSECGSWKVEVGRWEWEGGNGLKMVREFCFAKFVSIGGINFTKLKNLTGRCHWPLAMLLAVGDADQRQEDKPVADEVT